MRNRNRLGRSLGAAGLLVALASAGCTGVIKDRRTIEINSTPPGAGVYASGAKIGTTPMSIVPDEVFPPRMVGFSYRAVGTLNIKKPGCETYTRQVNDAVLSKDIMVHLKCDPNYHPAAPMPAPHAAAPAPTPNASAEQRLRRLERLHRDGLITDQEYQRIRKRILNTL